MTPTLVHRYAFPLREVIETLLGAAAGDAEAWQARVEGEQIVIDIMGPATGQKPGVGAAQGSPADERSGETSPDLPAEEPELKGGPLAQRAAIACGERSFRTFIGVDTADEAKADLCRRCGITTRKMLDHSAKAAEVWRGIDGKYRLWLDGYDVELD